MVFDNAKAEIMDPNKSRSHAFVAMSKTSQELRSKLPRLNIHPHHPHLVSFSFFINPS